MVVPDHAGNWPSASTGRKAGFRCVGLAQSGKQLVDRAPARGCCGFDDPLTCGSFSGLTNDGPAQVPSAPTASARRRKSWVRGAPVASAVCDRGHVPFVAGPFQPGATPN